MATQLVPVMRVKVDPNPRGSATTHVTMPAANPFERETISIRSANQPRSMLPGMGQGPDRFSQVATGGKEGMQLMPYAGPAPQIDYTGLLARVQDSLRRRQKHIRDMKRAGYPRDMIQRQYELQAQARKLVARLRRDIRNQKRGIDGLTGDEMMPGMGAVTSYEKYETMPLSAAPKDPAAATGFDWSGLFKGISTAAIDVGKEAAVQELNKPSATSAQASTTQALLAAAASNLAARRATPLPVGTQTPVIVQAPSKLPWIIGGVAILAVGGVLFMTMRGGSRRRRR